MGSLSLRQVLWRQNGATASLSQRGRSARVVQSCDAIVSPHLIISKKAARGIHMSFAQHLFSFSVLFITCREDIVFLV